VIALPAGTQIWIAAGVTDMRRGLHGLSAQVQTVLEQQPLSGHVLWFDGDGLCLLAKRLERGAADDERYGVFEPRPAVDTAMLLEGSTGERLFGPLHRS
jgi:transposase